MRVVIVEDEINAYEYLSLLLGKLDDEIEVIAHHDSIYASVNFFKSQPEVDLIFMDIQIADGLSFEIFDHVQIEKPVIFTTAFDEYAVDAFRVHSVDYLLKPILLEDLQRSIDKFKRLHSGEASSVVPSDLSTMIQKMTRPKKNRCLVKKGGHFEYVNVNDIAFVRSEDSMTFLFTQNGDRFIYSKTVEQLFNELDEREFYQINRSQIVSAKAIKEIHPFLNQRLKLLLNTPRTDDFEFIVSRQRMASFKEWMDG